MESPSVRPSTCPSHHVVAGDGRRRLAVDDAARPRRRTGGACGRREVTLAVGLDQQTGVEGAGAALDALHDAAGARRRPRSRAQPRAACTDGPSSGSAPAAMWPGRGCSATSRAGPPGPRPASAARATSAPATSMLRSRVGARRELHGRHPDDLVVLRGAHRAAGVVRPADVRDWVRPRDPTGRRDVG